MQFLVQTCSLRRAKRTAQCYSVIAAEEIPRYSDNEEDVAMELVL